MTMTRDNVQIATPCTLDWTKMKPTQGGRFCGDCKKVVRDLSKMTEADARELLANRERGGSELCVRFLYDQHGRVFFQDAQSHLVPAGSLLSRAKRAATTMALAALPLATAACDVLDGPPLGGPLGFTTSEQKEDTELHPMMGAMEYVPPAPAQDGGSDAEATTSDGGVDAAIDADAVKPDAAAAADGGVVEIY